MSPDVNGVKMVGMNGRRPDRYHHGDLRNALVGAAITQAREGGPDAVVLREAARRVGVSAAAAYHHFGNRDELVEAVKQRSLALLTEQMHAALAEENAPAASGAARPAGEGAAAASAVASLTQDSAPAAASAVAPPTQDGAPGGDLAARAGAARRRLRALGLAYLRFAAAEPGLFRLAFGPRGGWPAAGPAGPQHAATDPFRLLSQALDELTAAGAVPTGRRPGLEYVVWAAVHGVAVLCLDGPLASAGAAQCEQLTERALDTIIRGL